MRKWIYERYEKIKVWMIWENQIMNDMRKSNYEWYDNIELWMIWENQIMNGMRRRGRPDGWLQGKVDATTGSTRRMVARKIKNSKFGRLPNSEFWILQGNQPASQQPASQPAASQPASQPAASSQPASQPAASQPASQPAQDRPKEQQEEQDTN